MKRVFEEILFALTAFAFALNVSRIVVHEIMPGYANGLAWRFVDKLLNGTCETPYCYRALVPWIVNAVQSVWPVPVPFIIISLDIVSLVAFAYILRSLLVSVYGNTFRVRAMSFVGWLLVPFCYLLPLARHSAIYDFTALAFFTLGLYLIRCNKWLWMAVLFPIFTLNRETSIFLVLAYVLVNWRHVTRFGQAAKLVVQRAAYLGLVWILVKASLWCIFWNNIYGCGYEGLYLPNLFSNVDLLWKAGETSPVQVWCQLLGIFGGIWLPILVYRGAIRHQFTRGVLLLLPFWFATMFYVGLVIEMRIYGELIPLIVLAFSDLVLGVDPVECKNPS